MTFFLLVQTIKLLKRNLMNGEHYVHTPINLSAINWIFVRVHVPDNHKYYKWQSFHHYH